MQTGTTTFRVLDTLARTIGESHSIRSLADEVASAHGTGHYPNVHEQLQALAGEGIVSFDQAGRSKIPRLRLDRTGFPDTMAALELWRKRRLIDENPAAAEAVNRLETTLAANEHVRSIGLAAPDRNLSLRRLEPIVLLQEPSSSQDGAQAGDVAIGIAEQLSQLEDDISLRIDAWFPSAKRFGERLKMRDANPAPRLLRIQTCIWNPQAFWQAIAEGLPHGQGLAPETPARLGSLEEPQLAWNLTRWGYEERGRELDDEAPRLCPEAAAIGALAADVPRWIGAAGVVLAKAEIEPTLLEYLAKAEDQAGALAGILAILQDRMPKPDLEHTLELLEAQYIDSTPVEQNMVLDALELYGG